VSTPTSYCEDCKTVSNTQNSGHGSLRYAIDCAVPGSTLAYNPALDNSVINLTQTIEINKNLDLSTSFSITINGSGINGPVFSITPNKYVIIDGFGVICSDIGATSCIQNQGILTLENVNFETANQDPGSSSILNQNNGHIRIKNNVHINENP
jgi:hypothetical protein